MTMSILHRATGAALAAGTLMAVWLLVAAALGESAWTVFTGFCAHPLGQFMLFGWSVSLFYHLCNGVRHLIWDTGYLFKRRNANIAGLIVLAATVLLTIALWGKVWFS